MRPLLAFLLLSVVFSCAPPVEKAVGKLEADVKAIRDVFTGLDEAGRTGDAEKWFALLSEDAVFMPPGAAPIVGKAAVREWSEPFLGHYAIDETTSIEEVEVVADWAWVRAGYTSRVTPVEGGEVLEDVGKALVVLRKQSDGSWKAARYIWNSNSSLPETE